MKALISPDNNLVIQVEADSNTFPVAEPLYWITCPDTIVAYQYQYNNGEFSLYDIPTPPTVIPQSVSMRQARLALLQAGLLETVNQAVNTGGEADKITWEYATEVNRTDALVSNMAVALGLTEQQLDELFILASTL